MLALSQVERPLRQAARELGFEFDGQESFGIDARLVFRKLTPGGGIDFDNKEDRKHDRFIEVK